MALGAAPRDVGRWIGGRALRLTALGLGLGVLGSLALTGVLTRALFEVSPLDPVTYASVVATLGGTAMLAAWLPARRGTRVDPVSVIRDDA